jgi:hypothetical protein
VAAAICAFVFGAFVAGQSPQFSAERIKAHVTFLADDLLEGREAGTRGHEIAARYVAAEFELLGLKPGGTNGSYFETVQLLESAQAKPDPTIVVTSPRDTQTFTQGTTAAIQGPIAGGEVALKAPVVFVGYGMKDDTLGIDDYGGLDVRGKVALALWGSPKGMDSEIAAHLGSQRFRVAAEHGAAALVAIPTRGLLAAVPWQALVGFASEPATTWVRKDGTPFDPGHGLNARAVVEPKAAAVLFEGAPRTLDQILDEADKEGGRPAGFVLKATSEIKVTTTARRFSSPDVIGVLEGSDPKLKNEYVALMAHADHIGVKKEGAGDRINNGALDNAAGTATLIEVARAFATAPERPRRSIIFVANTAEEKGLLGAEYFAHYPGVPIEQITAAIDLDMPMLLYDFTDAVAYGAGHSTLQRVVRSAGAQMGVKLSPDPMPDQAIFVRSDHYPMVKAGVPAVMLATGMANGGEAAWGKFMSNNYHQPSDDVTQPIVWSAGAKFAELNYRVVRTLADDDEPARWYEEDYFGKLYAPKAKKAAKGSEQ